MRPTGPSIPHAVAARALDTPDAVAISAHDDVLTYADLEQRARCLADRLCDLGIGPGIVVAVCLPRSAAFVVATLAVLKAGAAYLPIDAATPTERVQLMLSDCGPYAVIVDRDVAAAPDGPWAEIDVRDARGWAEAPARAYEGAHPDHLAYVIYTSGSCGRPNGVEVTHGSLINLVAWHQRAFAITPEDRAHFYASPAFDASVWETWPYLAAGASIHLPPEGVRGEPEALRDWMLAERITIGFVPTPLAERMLALAWPPRTPLRALLTGADTLHRYPSPALPFQLVNNYGPAECTVVSTSGVVAAGADGSLPPIGRAIDNVDVLILDAARRPVPAGSAGELYIGGAGLARGYRNRPELTADRFIPHPTVPGARLYRTGDRARLLPDGSIAFLGRQEDEVTVHGRRVDLREITAALTAHAGVLAATVVASEGAEGERELIAYVVPTPGAALSRASLVWKLRRRLPSHMLPSVYVTVKALPVTPNGKIDRQALPKPDARNTLRAMARTRLARAA